MHASLWCKGCPAGLRRYREIVDREIVKCPAPRRGVLQYPRGLLRERPVLAGGRPRAAGSSQLMSYVRTWHVRGAQPNGPSENLRRRQEMAQFNTFSPCVEVQREIVLAVVAVMGAFKGIALGDPQRQRHQGPPTGWLVSSTGRARFLQDHLHRGVPQHLVSKRISDSRAGWCAVTRRSVKCLAQKTVDSAPPMEAFRSMRVALLRLGRVILLQLKKG